MRYIFVCPDDTERMETVAQKIKEYQPRNPLVISSPLGVVMRGTRVLGFSLNIDPECTILAMWFDNTVAENTRSAEGMLAHFNSRQRASGSDTIVFVAKGRELYYTALMIMLRYLPDVPVIPRDFFFNRGDTIIIDTSEKAVHSFKK